MHHKSMAMNMLSKCDTGLRVALVMFVTCFLWLFWTNGPEIRTAIIVRCLTAAIANFVPSGFCTGLRQGIPAFAVAGHALDGRFNFTTAGPSCLAGRYTELRVQLPLSTPQRLLLPEDSPP